MKFLKRALAIVLLLSVCAMEVDPSIFAVSSAKAEYVAYGSTDVGEKPEDLLSCGEWLYWLDGDYAIVAGYANGSAQSLKIPARLDGHSVIGIGQSAFEANTALQSVELHNNVIRIADDAFAGNEGVTLKAYNGSYALKYAGEQGMESVNLTDMSRQTPVENVIDMAGAPANSYQSLTDGSVKLVTDDTLFLRQGAVVLFPASSQYPTGLARTVESVDKSSANGAAVLSQPEFGEVFEEIHGIEEAYVDWSKGKYCEGVSFVDANEASGQSDTLKISKTSRLSIDMSSIKLSKDWSLTGSVGITFGPATIEYQLKRKDKNDVEGRYIKINLTTVTEKNASLKYKKSLLNSSQSRLVKRQTIATEIPFCDAGGIVNGYLALDLVCEFSGELTVKTTTTVVHTFTFQNGKAGYDKTKDENIKTLEAKGQIKFGPEFKVYFVLGWSGISIRILEASSGLYLVVSANLKNTKVEGCTDTVRCVAIDAKVQVSVSFKIGLIKIFSKSGPYLSKTFTQELGKATMHFEWGEKGLDKVSVCTLSNRCVQFEPNNSTKVFEAKYDVNSKLKAPDEPKLSGCTFVGWYVDTNKSGLKGEDYKFDFSTMRMPYIANGGTLYLYAKWKDAYPVTSITLNRSSIEGLSNVGATCRLSTTSILPAQAKNKAVRWWSDNNSVARVDSNGLVRLLNAGTANIICASVNDSAVRATCAVTVKQSVTGITLNKSNILRYSDDMSDIQLTADVLPASAANKAVSWSSDNSAVAEVSDTGRVTLKGLGVATITCRSASNPNVASSCAIAVRRAVTSVKLDQMQPSDHLRTNADMSALKLSASVEPADAFNKSLKWTSDNESVATVSADGTVSMKGLGKVTITCESVSNPGKKDSFYLEITQAVTAVTLSEKAVTKYSDYTSHDKGQITLTSTVEPANAGNKSVTWETTDADVVSVKEGVVEIVGAGSASVICRSVSNPEVYGECKFTVLQAVKEIGMQEAAISKNEDSINPIYMDQMISVLPETASNKAVTWKSSNPNVAWVTQDGVVVTRSKGETVITCTSVSTPYISAECKVTVTAGVTGISLSELNLFAYRDSADTSEDTYQLHATVETETQTDTQVNWSSSDEKVATVSNGGIVTIVGVGDAEITCASAIKPEINKKCVVTVKQSVTGISLDQNKIDCLSGANKTVKLGATVAPESAYNKDLVWTSSNENVAAVSSEGSVTIAGPGEAVITCSSVSNPGVSATCKVTVRQAVTAVGISAREITRYTNEKGTIQLEERIYPSYADNRNVKWTSSNESVVTVSESGLVSVIGAGSATVSCESAENSEMKAECTFTIKQGVDELQLDKTTLELYTNETDDIALTATVLPENAPDRDLIWTSSDPDIVTVTDNGQLAILATGKANITCVSAANPNARRTCEVTVIAAVESIILNESEIECYSDETVQLQLSANVQPAYANDKSVTWTSSNENVVSVAADGKLTLKGVGSAQISCASVGNPDVTATCKISVKQPMTAITLDKSAISLYNDDEAGIGLTATLTPEDTDDTGIIWGSNNTAVAIVSDTGLVLPMTQGEAKITCRSARNPETILAECDVSVMQRVETVTVEGDTSSLLTGETLQLSGNCVPETATNTALAWSTDNDEVATVDANGLVTAVAPGSATITATAEDGSGVSGSYPISVENDLQLDVVSGEDTLYTQGTQSVALASVTPGNASVRRAIENGAELTWTLSKTNEDDDVEMQIVETSFTEGDTEYKSSYVVLWGSAFPTAGKRSYTVTCTAGGYSSSVEIPVTVDGSACAQNIAVSPSTFEVDIGEAAVISTEVKSADDNPLPDNLTLSELYIDPEAQQHAIVEEEDGCYRVSFDESDIYTATATYSASNISYDVKLSFYVHDENGTVRVKVDSVEIDNKSVSLVEGETIRLSAATEPVDAYDGTFTWLSEDESVATVDRDGTVKAVAPGRTAIVCTANDGSGASAICAVSVEKYLQLDDNTLEYTIYTGGQAHADLGIVNTTIDTEKRLLASGENVTWKLEKQSGEACDISVEEFKAEAEEGLSVSGNVIKLLRVNASGTDEYLLSCRSGEYTDGCRIVINVIETALPESIRLDTTRYTAKVNETIEVSAAYSGGELPEGTSVTIEGGRAYENAVSDEYDFTEPMKQVFDKAGTYTANIVFSGDNYSYSCPITFEISDENGVVPINVTDIDVDTEELYMQVGEQYSMTMTVTPGEAACSEPTWYSSDTSVVSVSTDGKVSAIGAGMAFVSATIPEFDDAAGCLVIVEDGITAQSDSVSRTVFTDGVTRMTLDTVQLTAASSYRLKEAPTWTLNRCSGDNLTLKLKEYNTVDLEGNTIYGCAIVLYSMSREGLTNYELVCSAGDEEITVPVSVNAVARDRNLPSGLSFAQTVFEADVNELIRVEPEVTCLPEGTKLPDGLRVTLQGDSLFDAHVNTDDYYVSQNTSTMSFDRAGLYEATFIYEYSNVRYAIPVTFRIRDEVGNVPTLATSFSLSAPSMWLTEGEEATLGAVFTPSDASDQGVTWSSTDETVVTVDENGKVKALKKGEAEIICTPSDAALAKKSCLVWVEDYLTSTNGSAETTLYKQGEQSNEVFSMILSEGTRQRLEKAELTAQWEVTRVSGEHTQVKAQITEDNGALIVNTTALQDGGTDVYRVTCKAGEKSISAEFTVNVVDDPNVAQRITLRQTSVDAELGKAFSVDFTPVCEPAGSCMPTDESMWSLYAGIGTDYQNAVDRTTYKEDGDSVTLCFNLPGRYIFTRQFFLANLHYYQVCEINVGKSVAALNMLEADTQDTTLYMGGKIGRVAGVSLKDTLLKDVYGEDIKWSLECVSGDCMTATLKETGNGVDLYAVNAGKEGESVWRVTCAFGDYSDSTDIKVRVCKPRAAIPERVSLAENSLSGRIGDRLSMPIAVICSPTGSALPESGDDFWSFEPEGAAADVCDWQIEDGMLRVKLSQPGYYTGTLKYKAGTFGYDMTVYMQASDEEGVLNPPTMEMYLVNAADTVYTQGRTNVAIATAKLNRGLGTYHSGEAQAYMNAHPGTWEIRITSGAGATLALEPNGNTAEVMLTSIEKPGTIEYSVSCTVEDKVYSQSGTLVVADAETALPDPILGRTIYRGAAGEQLTIPITVYERDTGSILQSSASWDPDELRPVIGGEYTRQADSLAVTFYEEGTYETSMTVDVGNLRYEIPFTVVIGDDDKAVYNTLKLPAALRVIEANAFESVDAEVVDLRGTRITAIGKGAFKNCGNLIRVYLPSTVKDIADDAFAGCADVTFICAQGSTADAYASDHDIAVRYE